jgi:invasion protein IalB
MYRQGSRIALVTLVLAANVASGPVGAQQAPTTNPASTTQNIKTVDSGWQVICRPNQPDRTKLICTALFETQTAAEHVRISAIEIGKTDKGYVAAVTTPLGMNLKSGIELQLDGSKFAQAAYSSCLNTGCVAEVPLTDAMYASLQKGKSLSLSFSDLQGSTLKSEAALTGLPAALAKIAP